MAVSFAEEDAALLKVRQTDKYTSNPMTIAVYLIAMFWCSYRLLAGTSQKSAPFHSALVHVDHV